MEPGTDSHSIVIAFIPEEWETDKCVIAYPRIVHLGLIAGETEILLIELGDPVSNSSFHGEEDDTTLLFCR